MNLTSFIFRRIIPVWVVSAVLGCLMMTDSQAAAAGEMRIRESKETINLRIDDGTALGIGTSITEPRVFQTEYDATRRELRIRFDIGLSPDAGYWVNRGFEDAELLPCRLDGVYLDALVCYLCNLNYRQSHWPYAEDTAVYRIDKAK